MKQLKYHMVFQGLSNLLNPNIEAKSLTAVSTDSNQVSTEQNSPEANGPLTQNLTISAIAQYDQISFQTENPYLTYILQSSPDNRVRFEVGTIDSDNGSLQATGRICFGGHQHVLHLSTLGQGQLLDVPDLQSQQGAIAFQVNGGTGLFDHATGTIATNFLVDKQGNYRDAHTASIFLQSQSEDSVAQENRLLVRDVLEEKAFPVTEDVSMEYIADLLVLTNASQLMVIDRSGNFIGVVSEVDLLQALIPDIDEILRIGGTLKDALNIFIRNGRDLAGQRIARLVKMNPRTANPNDELLAVATIMLQEDIRRLPVVEQGKFVGSVALSDICWALLSKWNGLKQS
ncbi:MAG: CBS domain-containing protein [Cyanothece sp. SIO2G6]|nr:CBS domain-containing protein [Cyanothece sp. SIO2G6]